MNSITLQMAANVAWHVRVNGPQRVSEENIRLMAAALEYLVEQKRAHDQATTHPGSGDHVHDQIVSATPTR